MRRWHHLAAAACVVAAPGVAQLMLGLRVDHLLATWFAIVLVATCVLDVLYSPPT